MVYYLRGMNTISGEATLSKLFWLIYEKGLYSKKETVPFRVAPFQMGHGMQEKTHQVTKVVQFVCVKLSEGKHQEPFFKAANLANIKYDQNSELHNDVKFL